MLPTKPTVPAMGIKPTPTTTKPSGVTVTPTLMNQSDLIKVPTADVMMIYGSSRTRKTTQLAHIAEWLYEQTGNPSRLITFEQGAGMDHIQPWVDAGMIDVLSMSVEESQLELLAILRAVCSGSWTPFFKHGTHTKMTPAARNGLAEGKVAAYFFEGLSTGAQALLQELANKQRKISQDVVGAFQVPSLSEGVDAEKYGNAAQSHYGFVQQRMLEVIQSLAMLPVRMVVFTAHEAKGEDKVSRMPEVGPGTVGGAITSRLPAYVGDMFHCQTVVDNKGGESVKAWFKKHPDDQVSSIIWPAGPRTLAEFMPQLEAEFPGGAIDLDKKNIVDFLKLKQKLKSSKTDSLLEKKRKIDAQRKAALEQPQSAMAGDGTGEAAG